MIILFLTFYRSSKVKWIRYPSSVNQHIRIRQTLYEESKYFGIIHIQIEENEFAFYKGNTKLWF